MYKFVYLVYLLVLLSTTVAQYAPYYSYCHFPAPPDIIPTTSTTPSAPERSSGRRQCNIWCWLRRVSLFVVQQLLADEGVEMT